MSVIFNFKWLPSSNYNQYSDLLTLGQGFTKIQTKHYYNQQWLNSNLFLSCFLIPHPPSFTGSLLPAYNDTGLFPPKTLLSWPQILLLLLLQGLLSIHSQAPRQSCPQHLSPISHLTRSLFFLAALHSLQDLSSLTRDWTQTTAVKVPSPNHWTARELPHLILSWSTSTDLLSLLFSFNCSC